jgi:cell division protein FtsI (penicillin-binding protein 3)
VLNEQQAVMPDLKGISLRRALQILQPYDLEVKVQGAGQVVKQFPEPGRVLKGARCVLELRMDS